MPDMSSSSLDRDEGELWPMASLRARRQAFLDRPPWARPPRGFAVLLTTGALNPVHAGHVEMLRSAAQRLEEAGYGVLAAYLSPSHDAYVQSKAMHLNTVGLTGEFRAELVRRTVRGFGASESSDDSIDSLVSEGDGLVEFGGWEAAQPGFVGYWVVSLELQSHLVEEGIDARVFYACGTDMALRFHLGSGMRCGIGLVVVPRAGDRPPREHRREDRVLVARPTPGEISMFSSTKIREAVGRRDEEYIRRTMAPPAAQLLLYPSPEEEERFEKDFSRLRGG